MRTARYGMIVILMVLMNGIMKGQTAFDMSSGNYSEGFADIANWTNAFAAGTGASHWGSVAVNATGTIPSGTRITTTSATFVTGSSGGVQKGSAQTSATTSIVLLSTGSTDNASSTAIDLFLNFTGRIAGTLSFDWSSVNNSTGNRAGSLRIYTSTDGTTFTELTGAQVLNFVNNTVTSGSITTVQLPSGFDNSSTARIRFYYHNGSGGSTGSRPKVSIDNISVTSTSGSSPNIIASTTSLSSFGSITVGTSSSQSSFTVEGSNLTNDIVVTPPTNFELSQTSGSGFSTSAITLTQSSGAVAVTTIYVRFTPLSSGSFSSNITATSTGATSKNIAVSGNGVTNYYSASSGSLDLVTSWGTNTNGTGTNPTDFTSNYQVFNIQNNSTPTIGASWTVSGTGSKIVLGDGTNAVDFSIPSAMTVTGTIDLSANSTLSLYHSTLSHTYGTVSSSSTINYAQTGTYALPSTPTTYQNVKITGGTKTFSSGTYTIAGNLTVDGVTDFDGAGSPFTTINLAGNFTLMNSTTFASATTNRFTLVCNGTTAQTLQGNGSAFHLFRITTNNTEGVTLSTSGGSSNASLGNATSGGVSLTNGNLKTNSNTITLVGAGVITSGNETAAKYIEGNVTLTRTIGTGSSTSGNLGLSLAAGTDDLGDVTVTRVTGSSGIVTVSANSGIARKYTVTSTNPPSAGRDVTITWLSSDDNSKTLTAGVLYKSTNSGSTWSQVASGDYSTRSVVLSGQTSFGMYTVSDNSNPLPVELVSLTATAKGRGVELAWKTATEVNNAGFEIQRSEVGGQWSKVGFVEGNGTTNAPKSYSFVDASAKGTVSYRLKQIDRDGQFEYSSVVNATVAMTAADYELSQNFPNPFNPNTNITFAMKTSENVNVTVYNSLGQAVATLFNDLANANQVYTLSFDGKNLSSGTYFYALRSASRNEVRKMLLSK